MKASIDSKQVKFYSVAGIAYLSLWLLHAFDKYPESFSNRALNETWRAMYIVALNFIFFEYILRQLKSNKIFRSLILLLILFFLCSFGLAIWRFIGIQLHIYTVYVSYSSARSLVSHQVSATVTSILFFGLLKHIYDYVQLRQVTQQLRIEKQAAELSYLKSQTNPHFLFNTLNNIYSLARDKSDLAPESILRLSQILRFMLYETGGDFISIEQELKIIGDYIALEKLRYDESLRINLNHDIEDMKQALPPLLLIPLVENAFKHGVSETRSHPFIDIHLSVNKRQLLFWVKNSSEISSGNVVKENIGLSNLRRQLELLYTDYNLSVQQGESVFIATLKINLASHV